MNTTTEGAPVHSTTSADDVDPFRRPERTALVPTDLIVHEQDGTPRFNRVEHHGVRRQKLVVAR
jgi:hypothetical protein